MSGAMSDKVRLVVAGAGKFGCEHLRILSAMKNVTLAGVADIVESAAEDACRRFGALEAGSDAREMVGRLRPDGLVIATPGPTHAALAGHALELGIPVLLEKPVAISAAEATTLAEAEARSRAFVLPGHILRFSAPHRRLVEIARSAAVGPIVSVTARRHRDDSHARRYAEDPVLMTMVHDIDLALWITGSTPDEVLAYRHPARTPRSETLMMGASPGGAVWRLTTAWTFPTLSPPPDRIEVVGERGSVELEAGVAIRAYGEAPLNLDVSAADPDQPHEAELLYFIDCVRQGTKPEAVTLADAIAGLRVADAVLGSLAKGAVTRTNSFAAG
jgi:predicted dehydrogenase